MIFKLENYKDERWLMHCNTEEEAKNFHFGISMELIRAITLMKERFVLGISSLLCLIMLVDTLQY